MCIVQLTTSTSRHRPFSTRLLFNIETKHFAPILAVKNLRTGLDVENKAFYSPGTQHGRRVTRVTSVLLRVEDTEFAKQLVYCILYCTVGHCFEFLCLLFCNFCVFFLKPVKFIDKFFPLVATKYFSVKNK